MQRVWRAAVLFCGLWTGLSTDAMQQEGAQRTEGESATITFSVAAIPLIPAQAKDEQEPGQQQDEAAAAIVAKPISKDAFDATHSEIAPLVPRHDGEPVTLHTFRLDGNQNIVAGVTAGKDRQGYVQIYSPELELTHEFATPFEPTAITLDPSGNLIAAGNGKIGKFTPDGTAIKVCDAPNISGQDQDALRREIVEQYKESMKEVVKNYEAQIEALKTSIKELEDLKQEKGESFAKRDANRLKAMARQLESYESVIGQFSGELPEEQVTAMMSHRSGIPSIAANAQDVFVTTSSGMGYEIWRTDHQFENAERIVNGLRGCCGQMDIYASDDQLLVAENTRFEVGLYNRDGERQAAFGERAQGAGNGFGSCCNPMNVLCCSNGEILTAESSIGKIKRFSAEGDLLGYVGKARIGGGCKHVALGYDSGRDRYYIQYQDKNQICLLIPNSEAETLLAEKRAIQAQGEKFVAKIAGDWQLDPAVAKPAAKQEKAADEGDAGQPEAMEITEFDYTQFVEQMTNFAKLSIDVDGHKFIATMGEGGEEMAQQGPQNLRWEVASIQADKVTLELEGEDGMIMFGAEISQVDEDTIRVRFSYDAVQQFGKEKTYARAAVPTSTEAGR